MPSENLEQFEIQKLLLEAHSHDPTSVQVSTGVGGFITNIVVEIPTDRFDWLYTEIGSKVGVAATNRIDADHEIEFGRDETGFPQRSTTLLGLWRGFE